MATLTIPVTLVPNTNENITDVKTNFDAVATAVNSIDDSNVSAAAGIQASKLATGATGLAQGAFYAYRAGALSLASNTLITFETERFDVSGWFDTVTNVGRFTPLVAGYYRFSWGSEAGGVLAADTYWLTELFKNGSQHAVGQVGNQRGATLPVRSVGSAIAQANGTTDYFTIQQHHNVGSAQVMGVGAPLLFFCGELIGRS